MGHFKIIKKHKYHYCLPFTQELKGKKVNQKKSVLYFIESPVGLLTTELSPFPGLSHSNLPELEKLFENQIKKGSYNSENPHLAFSFFELNLKLNWNKESILESVISNTLIHYQQISLPTLTPASTLKVKIDDDISSILSFFKAQAKYLKGHPLRIDSNRRLTLENVKTISKYLSDLQLTLDYFEEPFKNIDDYHKCSIPYAFDESIARYKDFSPQALVFKPTQHFSNELWSSINKKQVIISATFDSLFTKATLTAMATEFKGLVHGLNAVSSYSEIALNQDQALLENQIFPALDSEVFEKIFIDK